MVLQHQPLRKTLASAAGVIGFAAVGAVLIYFTTGLLRFLSNDTP